MEDNPSHKNEETDIVLVQTFDQNAFSMLCEKAHKACSEKFFGTLAAGSPEDDDDDGATLEIKTEKLDQLGHL